MPVRSSLLRNEEGLMMLSRDSNRVPILVGIYGVNGLPKSEANGRKHIEFFPNIQIASTEVVDELRSIILRAHTDILTSPAASTVNHTEGELGTMLSLVEASRGDPWILG